MSTITKKIQALLALSNSPNEHEALAAASKAHALIAKYNLSLTEIQATDTENTDTVGHRTTSSKIGATWIRQVWQSTAKLYFCDYMYSRGSHKTNHWLIGAEHNTVVAQSMAEYLTSTVVRMSKTVPNFQEASFRQGCAHRLAHNMRELRVKDTTPATTSDSNLPVLYAHHDRIIKDYMKATFGESKASKSRSIKIGSNAGYTAGRAAADNISLNTQLNSNSNQKAIT